MPSIGEKLQVVQRHLGLTQKQLAEKTGVHFKSLNNYLKGRTTPDAKFLERLCRELNLSPAWVLLGEGEMLAEGSGHGAALSANSRRAVINAFAWIGQTKKEKIRKFLSVLLRLERRDRFEKLYEQVGPKRLTARMAEQLGEVSRKMDLLEWEVLIAHGAYEMAKISEEYGAQSDILVRIARSAGDDKRSSRRLLDVFQTSLIDFERAWKDVLERKEFQ